MIDPGYFSRKAPNQRTSLRRGSRFGFNARTGGRRELTEHLTLFQTLKLRFGRREIGLQPECDCQLADRVGVPAFLRVQRGEEQAGLRVRGLTALGRIG